VDVKQLDRFCPKTFLTAFMFALQVRGGIVEYIAVPVGIARDRGFCGNRKMRLGTWIGSHIGSDDGLGGPMQ